MNMPMKNKRWLIALAFITGLALCLALLLGAIQVVAFDRGHYQREYEALGVAEEIGISEADLMRATETLLDYCRGRRADLDCSVTVNGQEQNAYNEREIAHMADVQKLFSLTKNVCNALLLVAFIGILIALKKADYRFGKGMFFGLLAGLGFLGIIGAMVVIDFGWFWTTFHETLFSNDLWLLDPATDMLIQMVPEAFFYHTCMRILGLFALSWAALAALCGWIWHRGKKAVSD